MGAALAARALKKGYKDAPLFLYTDSWRILGLGFVTLIFGEVSVGALGNTYGKEWSITEIGGAAKDDASNDRHPLPQPTSSVAAAALRTE